MTLSDLVAAQATSATLAQHAATPPAPDPSGRLEHEEAHRGFLGTLADPVIRTADGRVVADLDASSFLDGDAPGTVHPSLWRHAGLDRLHGLFEVVDGLYQVRGFDASVMTIVEGDTGVVIIDPLTSPHTAAAALGLYRQHRGERAVRGVVYTHSHADHFGGVHGVVSAEAVAAGDVVIVAPAEFLQEAVGENVYAGAAMGRRAMYQFGLALPADPHGTVGGGIGPLLPRDVTGLIAPTTHVEQDGERRVIDGVELEFVMASGTEAPSEFMVWLPQHRVLDTAEDVTRTLHNLYAPRGAQVRDARKWWRVIDHVLTTYGHRAEALIAQHHWPAWGTDRVVEILTDQRDLYKFLHDRTLHLANLGHTADEIPDLLDPPEALVAPWHNRGYYGTLRHNSRAVYHRYLGWYDANPAHWDPLPPAERATRRVEYMGGADAVLDRAEADLAAGEYRWVAEVASDVVFADPANARARRLGAAALEQLGYASESAVWRNLYLQGALELRQGPPAPRLTGLASPDLLGAMTTEMLFDYLAIRLDSTAAAHLSGTIGWRLVDGDAERTVSSELRHGLLVHRDSPAVDPAAEVTIDRRDLAALASGSVVWGDAPAEVTGDRSLVDGVFAALVTFTQEFAIVEP